MKSFQFRLERVLAWYRKKCRMEENRLAEALVAVRGVEDQIERFLAERTAIEGELVTRREIPAADFASLGRYRLRAREREAGLKEQLRTAETALAEQKVRTLKAQRKVKLVEKLRERQSAEYIAAADRELENLAAEVHLANWKPASRS